jgi:heme-degrading monooxygenase HmoA
VIASVHLADVGGRAALRLFRTKLDPAKVPGLRYAEIAIAAPLSSRLLPRPDPGRVGLIAAWDDDRAFEDFLADHSLAEQLAHGWHVRLAPTRIFGAWPQLPGLLANEEPMNDAEPAAVLTLGRLRLSQTTRFLKASAAAEGLAVREEALLASTGLARPPRLVATFSLWRSVAAMRAYAHGDGDPGHLAAIQAHTARPFHHESAFVRFRPYAAEGSWDGQNPLAATESKAPGLSTHSPSAAKRTPPIT